MNLPLVVAAYNRPDSLARLLNSLQVSEYPERVDIELIISIDFSGNSQCSKLANDFEWKHGKKRVICHNKKLGLKSHIITCGDLALNYDGIILLEDDLIVSPAFYYYSIAVVDFYSFYQNIAGISLYSYERNEFCDLPFSPVKDGQDTFFMKVPSSCGQIFLQKHWIAFKESFNKGIEINDTDYLPDQVFNWPETSWKKLYFKYMIKNNLYFVYPMHSYSSNMGDEGTHCPEINFIKTALTLKSDNFIFSLFGKTINIYDQFMEWEPTRVQILDNITDQWNNVAIDLYGFKPLVKIKESKIVTSRKVTESLGQIPINEHPIQLNLLKKSIHGFFDSFVFNIAEVKNVIEDSNVIKEYFTSCICPGLSQSFYDEGAQKVKQSIKYRVGNFLLRPFHIFMKMIK